jgi:ATP-binding cassette subfamily C protein
MLDAAARLIDQAAQSARSAHSTAQRRNEIVMLIGKPIRALAQVVVMGFAAWLVLEHNRSPAIIFATSLLFGRALAPIEGAIAGWKAFTAVLGVYRRLSDLLTPAGRPVTGRATLLDNPEGTLTVENVSVALPEYKCYPLNCVSFRLEPGECLGIIGASGSGKSTLGRIIAGISPPTAGRVLLGSVDVSVLRDSHGSRHLGYLPQEIDIIGDTVKEVIARLDVAEPEKVIEAAKLAGLHDTIMGLPDGYDTVVSNGGSGMLRGFRQRLGLARALFGRPSLVVLDQPNASLD